MISIDANKLILQFPGLASDEIRSPRSLLLFPPHRHNTENMSDMQNSEVPASLPRKRRRPATACEQCRRRKIGCDAEQPCGPCVRSRGALQCTYRIDAQTPSRISSSSPRQRVNAASRQGPLPVADALPLSSQHDELGTLQLRGGPTAVHGSQVAELTQPKPPSPNPGLTRTVRELNSRILALEQQLADRPKADQLQNTRDNDSRSCSTPPIRLRLRNATYKTRIFGQGHWLHAAESVREAHGVLCPSNAD